MATTRARLPNLALPKGLFETLVHNDKNIPVIEKFNHLISCLSGDALGTIKEFQITESNYEKAMQRESLR